jgi:hypothetical protein
LIWKKLKGNMLIGSEECWSKIILVGYVHPLISVDLRGIFPLAVIGIVELS